MMMQFLEAVPTSGKDTIKLGEFVILSTNEEGDVVVDLGQKSAWDHHIVIPRFVIEKALARDETNA